MVDLLWCSFNCLRLLRDFCVCKLETISDHLPIAISTSQDFLSTYNDQNSSCQTFRFIFDVEKLESFDHCMTWREEVSELEGDVNSLNDILISTIKSVATELGMRKMLPKDNTLASFFKNKPWFDNSCKLAKRAMYVAYNDCKTNNFQSDYFTLCKCLEWTYKKILKNKKREYETSQINE